jgi:hypothetical protein
VAACWSAAAAVLVFLSMAVAVRVARPARAEGVAAQRHVRAVRPQPVVAAGPDLHGEQRAHPMPGRPARPVQRGQPAVVVQTVHLVVQRAPQRLEPQEPREPLGWQPALIPWPAVEALLHHLLQVSISETHRRQTAFRLDRPQVERQQERQQERQEPI